MFVGIDQISGRYLLKVALVLIVGLALIWLSLGVTFTLALGKENPELALRWWPWGATSKAALASSIAVRQDSAAADLTRAEALARGALMREPVNLVATRTLGLIAAKRGELAKAERYFDYSEMLSRRDLTTQLWMIEKSVREDSIPQALLHYDRALRTSRQAADLLLPTLVAASGDPAIVDPLAQLLATRPEWWRDFLGVAVRDVKDARSLVTFSRSVQLSLSASEDQTYVRQIVERLVKDRLYAEAIAYYSEVRGTPPQQLVRDGDFNQDIHLLPLDWWFRNDSELFAMRELFDDNDFRLVLRASGGRGGEVARQLLVLKPGRYTISGDYGATDANGVARLIVEINCLDQPDLLRGELKSTGAQTQSFSLPFVIPNKNCGAQWLRFLTAPAVETDSWMDKIKVRQN